MQVDQLSREIVSSGRGNVLNLKIARSLDEVAQILSEQGANRYRVQAYRNAAANLRRLPKSADEIFKEGGEPGLRNIPAIGPRLARAIAALLLTGRAAHTGSPTRRERQRATLEIGAWDRQSLGCPPA